VRVPLQELEQQGAVAAADVDDRLVATPVDALEALEAALPALRHGAVEGGALVRMGGEPRPELRAEHTREGGRTATVEIDHRFEPATAEKLSEVVPAVRREELGDLRVPEDTRFFLRE